jgi:hypothetical protein
VRYRRSGNILDIHEHDTTAIGTRSYDHQPGPARTYNRFLVTQDSIFNDWIQFVLSLVPPGLQDVEGTVGINLFRTHSSVVNDEKPHQDDEQWVDILVTNKFCDGAETLLYENNEDGTPSDEATFGCDPASRRFSVLRRPTIPPQSDKADSTRQTFQYR